MQQTFVLCDKFLSSFVLQKNSICTEKIAISTFSHTSDIHLSIWHTLSYFPLLSQLLAHCSDLSKSEGQLCCHETGLKPDFKKSNFLFFKCRFSSPDLKSLPLLVGRYIVQFVASVEISD
jgi:hypothetical protein